MPKSLAELQGAVDDPQLGYEIHHIIEGQYASADEQSNARRFGGPVGRTGKSCSHSQMGARRDQLLYSRRNEDYGGLTPRAFLRGKSWEAQYEFGLRALRDAGVLR